MNGKFFLEKKLKEYFNFDHFRQGQKEIIQDVLDKNDVVGILPTGSGKSICYQLPARLLSGTTLVVSPLISLMMDQVNELKAIHFKEVVALNSFMGYQERVQVYEDMASYKLIYVSPEILQKEEVLGRLKKININLFVIDEAHCISQWGHEFRPDYLRLNHVIDQLGSPPILALSGTATPQVQDDIVQSLNRDHMKKHIYPMDRPNIAFHIEKVQHNDEKIKKIIELLSRFHVPTLIYFSSRYMTEIISEKLNSYLPEKEVAFYHGGMDQMDRIFIQQQFMNEQLDVICCTSAFGMGINKSNIRLVIHYHFSSQLESFIQEVGRAGRDGSASTSVLLYAKHDEQLPNSMILSELPNKIQIKYVFEQLLTLAKKGMVIPRTVEDINDFFRVNEIQWRFLNSQLERNGIIKDENIYINKEKAVIYSNEFIRYRNSRLQLKQLKLMNILEWINTKKCLRIELYKEFQDTLQDPKYQCCSNCGFLFSKWNPIELKNKKPSDTSWQIKLKSVLLIGDKDEAK